MQRRPIPPVPPSVAEVLAPFLTEHHQRTGVDLSDTATADATLMRLAAAYAELPSVVHEASHRLAFQLAQSPEQIDKDRALVNGGHQLLLATAEAIRNRLGRLDKPSTT
ncbi:hypothetical protein ACIBL3_46035 [Kribbella sp. NPDC050124]|uniref:hypothetical protein n=1 Tax=Kribbella sp. NPDC050124 TaxID=3364114 RepID=UPI003794C3F7